MSRVIDLDALRGRTFDAVLFDMDGTLIDSTALSLRAWHA
jgi:mannitol-1-/sugar-/sorbitol-6-phosphatase